MLKYHIRPLPYWVLTDLQPAFYDSESGTVLQQTSRMYAKLQEALKEFNDYAKQINKYITEFENGVISDFECFKNCIIKTMNDYIESIDMKMSIQDSKISEAIEYMKDNIVATATSVINQAIENGDINVSIQYDSPNEALNIVVTREGD